MTWGDDPSADGWKHIRQVRIAAVKEVQEKMVDPTYENYDRKFALRSFFNKVRKKRINVLKEDKIKVKFTLFLEPVPFLCTYNPGDEELVEFSPTFYDSFRHARHIYVTMLDIWYKKARAMRKTSDLP